MSRTHPRRRARLLMAALALAATGCQPQNQGAPRVVVIGDSAPRLANPADGPLIAPEAVLLQNVAQGLVALDAAGNIVGGLAERWNVSNDGLSYIFRLAPAEWDDGRKVDAKQVARLLKRSMTSRRNPLADALGSIEDVVAMTDRVIEIRLTAPRPNLLSILAQPEFAIVRDGHGTGPFSIDRKASAPGQLRLVREEQAGDDEQERREEVLLSASPAAKAIESFARGQADLVLGGTFTDLPLARRTKLARGALQFDPASGLFGLVPVRKDGPFDSVELRRLLSEAVDRDAFVAALGVPGLTPRATVLEPGLDGVAPPRPPAWAGVPIGDRRASLAGRASRFLPAASKKAEKPVVRIFLPKGPGGDMLLQELAVDWGAIGLAVERADSRADADFALIDEVAPSSSPAWFARRFRCSVQMPVCSEDADALLDAARQTQVPPQRYALIGQAAAIIDDEQLFIPLTAPVRWSLVSGSITGFAGNRFALHTLTNLTGSSTGRSGAQ